MDSDRNWQLTVLSFDTNTIRKWEYVIYIYAMEPNQFSHFHVFSKILQQKGI